MSASPTQKIPPSSMRRPLGPTQEEWAALSPDEQQRLEHRFGDAVACEEGVGAVSVVGVGIAADGALLCRALAALQSMGIRAAGVHSTALRLTLLVPVDQVPDAVRRLHGELVPVG